MHIVLAARHVVARPSQFVIGIGSVIPGWDKGMATMKKGEKAILKCSPENAYGAAGHPPVIPRNSTLLFEVELLSFGKAEESGCRVA